MVKNSASAKFSNALPQLVFNRLIKKVCSKIDCLNHETFFIRTAKEQDKIARLKQKKMSNTVSVTAITGLVRQAG
jgi:hypothetical protein